MTAARVAIDLNVRVRGNQTYAGFEDVQGYVVTGSVVEVWEPEANLVGMGIVTEVDPERKLVYLAVDWSSIGDEATRAPIPMTGNVGYSEYARYSMRSTGIKTSGDLLPA